jgi:GNAT superfamily N-acetyltransferase
MSESVVCVAVLTSRQCLDLARLHRKSLPHSALSGVSDAFIGSYYSFVVQSAHETLFCTVQSSVVGALVLSAKPHTLMRRFVLWYLLRGKWITRPLDLCRAVLRGVHDMLNPAVPLSELDGLSEIVQLYVDIDQRQKGLGMKLLQAAEIHLKKIFATAYFLKTENSPGNSAIVFYERAGFARVLVPASAQTSFIYFKKRL